MKSLLLILLASTAQALSIRTGGTFASVTASSLTVTNQAIFTNGNVGIGTANPGAKLHCSSCTIVADGTGATVKVNGTTLGTAVEMLTESTNGRININNGGALKIKLSGSEASYINSGANFGIGTTAPGGLLQVSSGSFIVNGTASTVIFTTMTASYGSGSAHVCVTNLGVLFASEAACP